MPRYPQAPWDYNCKCKHSCPHLQGRSTAWVFDEYQLNMPFVPASAKAFDRTATRKGQPLYEDLKEKVRNAAAAHADETS